LVANCQHFFFDVDGKQIDDDRSGEIFTHGFDISLEMQQQQ
jgi:hypothetical protein